MPPPAAPQRALLLCLGLYALHLTEEYATGMYDDPIIVFAYRAFSTLTPRQGTYLVFQVMLVLALAMTWLFNQGGRARELVLIGLALGLLAELHHVLRWLASHRYNPGLLTAWPMPVLGVHLLRLAGFTWKRTSRRTALAG